MFSSILSWFDNVNRERERLSKALEEIENLETQFNVLYGNGNNIQEEEAGTSTNNDPFEDNPNLLEEVEKWNVGNVSPEKAHMLETEGKAMQRLINGRVKKVARRMIYIEPGCVDICLDKVECNFLPKEGDLVKLKAVCAVDPHSSNLSGQVLLVEQVSALRSRQVIGRVTCWMSTRGEIEPLPLDGDRRSRDYPPESVLLELTQCVEGYIPELGDIVVADCIESKQDHLEWRAILVVKDQGNNNAKITHNVDSEEVDILRDKANIDILRNNSLGTVQFKDTKTLQVTMRNLGNSPIHLVAIYPHPRLCLKPQFELQKCPPLPFMLLTQIEFSVEFSCAARHLGASKDLFVFEFDGGVKIGRYLHVNVLGQLFEEPQTTSTQNRYRYQRNWQPQGEVDGPVIGVLRKGFTLDPFRKRISAYPVISRAWKLAMDPDLRGNQSAVYDALLNAFPPMYKELSPSNYKARWHDIIFIEEAETTVEMQKFDLRDVELHPLEDSTSEKLYELEVPGLSENRPSVVANDTVHVQHVRGGQKYEGLVHKVKLNGIILRFHERFEVPTASDRYTVRFRVARTQFRRMHAAIDAACLCLGPKLIFPSTNFELKRPQVLFDEFKQAPSKPRRSNLNLKANASPRVSVSERLFQCPSPPSPPITSDASSNGTSNVSTTTVANSSSNVSSNDQTDQTNSSSSLPRNIGTHSSRPHQKQQRTRHFRKLDFINKKLNAAQRAAVYHVLLGEARPLPYIIFGPPGTGKTMTLVETILQLHLILPDSRLLVATPSNSASDLLTERLLDSGLMMPGSLVRLVAICYEDHIPPRLVPYSKPLKGIGELQKRDEDEILERIVIGTLGTLGRLVQCSKLKTFTHVLLDEAGQATEPETMLVAALLGRPQQIVLAGDPMQLGPLVQGRGSAMAGLDISLLARLLHCGPYIRDSVGFPNTQGYNPYLVTMLVQNYRSVPEILALPDRLFYNSELVSTVSQHHGVEASLLCAMSADLPQRPAKEGPPALVFHGVRGTCRREADSPSWFNPDELYQAFVYISALYSKGLKPEQLGVISPYNKQVQKMRGLLYSMGLPVPKVGSVEEFQGQERLAIIFTAVRSSENCEEEGLGFLSSPNRMNTAITRARALLVVIGDPHILIEDTSWRALIADCLKRNAYCGCDVPPVLLASQSEITS